MGLIKSETVDFALVPEHRQKLSPTASYVANGCLWSHSQESEEGAKIGYEFIFPLGKTAQTICHPDGFITVWKGTTDL